MAFATRSESSSKEQFYMPTCHDITERILYKTYRPTFLFMNSNKYEHVKVVWVKENEIMHFAVAL